MQIRSPTVDDSIALSSILMSHRALLTIDPTGAGAEEFFKRVSPEAIAENIASSRFIHYVAEVDGTPIG
jgi:hypothetical protein